MKFQLLTILCLSFPVQAEQIVIASDIWCPYVCADNSGYLIEITQQAFLTVGVAAKFETIPFKRALRLAQKDKINAVLAVTQEHIERNALQSPSVVLGQYANDFYVHTSNHWQYTRLTDLDGKAVASILGYDYGDKLNQYLKQSPLSFHASGESPLKTNLNLLERERIDVLLGNRYVIEHTAQVFGYSKDIRFAGSEGIYTPLYMGFSHKDLEKNYQHRFAEGIENIKKSGQYHAILEKYHITPW